MTPRTQELVLKALDQGLVECIAEGFQAFLTRPDEDRHAAFMRGLNTAIGLHEQFISVLEPDKELQDAIQGRDQSERAQDEPAPHQAETLLP